jgi:hypothetical protein
LRLILSLLCLPRTLSLRSVKASQVEEKLSFSSLLSFSRIQTLLLGF